MAATRITLNTDNYDDHHEARKAVAFALRKLADDYEAANFKYIGRFFLTDHQGNYVSGDVDEL